MKIKSQAKRLREGPVFRLNQQETFGGAWELEGKGKGIGPFWETIGMFMDRKYALLLMKAITLKARKTAPPK